MKFNRSTEVAINLIAKLTDKPQTIVSLSARISEPRPFMEQIANRLRMSRVISVKRGPGGGIFLHRPVSAWDVITAFDGERDVPLNDFGLTYAAVKSTLQQIKLG